MKILGIRLLQFFSLLVMAYILYFQFFLEEQLTSSLVSNAKLYTRAYSLAMFWLGVVCFYSVYQQVLKTGQKPAAKSDNQ